MTRQEFYLKAMLQMAANPKYVEMAKSEDDPNVTFPSLLNEIIEIDAEALLKTAEKSWPDAFDKEPASGETFTIGEHLQNIHEAIESLEGELERQYDNEH